MYIATGLAIVVAVLNAAASSPVPSTQSNSFNSALNSVEAANKCPSGYSQPDNSGWDTCYKIYSSFKTKKAAARQCKDDGGSLASVPNSFVNSFLYYTASQNGATSLWLGIECFNGDANNCVDDDGVPFAFNNFYPGQPNVDGTCVYMSTIGRDSQKWLTFDCEQKFQFACEAKIGDYTAASTTTKSATTTTSRAIVTTPTTPAETTKKVRTCPTGYSFFQGVCYRKFDDAGDDGHNTRDQQSAQCKLIPGGYLATINSLAVQQFVDSLPCRNSYIRIGLRCPDIKTTGDTSSCVWDDGTPFQFNHFATGEPQMDYPNPCAYSYKGYWYNDRNSECNISFECSVCQAPALQNS